MTEAGHMTPDLSTWDGRPPGEFRINIFAASVTVVDTVSGVILGSFSSAEIARHVLYKVIGYEGVAPVRAGRAEYMVRTPISLSDPSAPDMERTFYDHSEANEFRNSILGSARLRGFEPRVDMFARTVTTSDWREVDR